MLPARWLVFVLSVTILLGTLARLAGGEPKAPSRPGGLVLNPPPHCAGRYDPRVGSNFGPCPGKWVRPWMSIQSPGDGPGTAAGATSGGSGGQGPGGHASGHSTGHGGGGPGGGKGR